MNIRYKNIILFLLFFLVALAFDYYVNHIHKYKIEDKDIEQVLHNKEKNVKKKLNYLSQSLSGDANKGKYDLFSEIQPKEEDGVSFFVFRNDSLIHWTNNSIPVNEIRTSGTNYFDKIGNGWYYAHTQTQNNYLVVGLILVKKDFSYKNEFINDGFQEDFDLPADLKISKKKNEGVLIHNSKGDFLFSISKEYYDKTPSVLLYLITSLYLLSLVFLVLFVFSEFRRIENQRKKITWMVVSLGFLIVLRWIMIAFKFPESIYKLEVFDPAYYASSSILPSLGDFLIDLLFAWIVLRIARQFLSRPPRINYSSKYLYSFLFIFLNVVFFFLFHYLFETLIFNSNISLAFYRFLDLTIYSFAGFFICLLLFTIYFLWIDFLHNKTSFLSLKEILILFVPVSLIVGFVFHYFIHELGLFSILFFYVSNLIVILIRFTNRNYNYSRYISIIFISVLFGVTFIQHHSNQKEQQKRKVLITNLEYERDRVGEMMLQEKEEKIKSDRKMNQLMMNPLENEEKILNYLQNQYFNDYFRKYNLQISVCSPYDSLEVNYEYENRINVYHCYSFFNDLINDEGVPLPGSNFYFLDNLNGRISYLGPLKFYETDSLREHSLFIALDSKISATQFGYPELLLDESLINSGPLSNYSYAKYKNNELVRKSGEYLFPMRLNFSFDEDEPYSFVDHKGYNHLLYKVNDDSLIVISKPKNSFLDNLAQFSYLFAFFYIGFIIYAFISNFPRNITRFNYNFKNKITLSMVLLLFLSMIAVGAGTLFYTTQQFQEKQKETIEEKLQSILVELRDKLGNEPALDQRYSEYLNHLLIKFSNVFYVDMNLYDLEGNLIASSREQVFEKALMGRKINPEAYHQLAGENERRFIHTESIGDLDYQSAYVPFYNNYNEVLAYLNLPYFKRQKTLRKDIYTVIMVMVNIYVFLIILGSVVAVLVSNNITKPLNLIRKKIGKIGLDKRNEKIDYESHDEIGALINEYNRMIEQLEENARVMAQTERESAWREMAKQIAHEIKNPLTPMKLKVQYLKRAWEDNVSDFDERVQKFSDAMINQINTLSGIATEFSNFAKMPRAQNQQLLLEEEMDQAIHMLEHTRDIKFSRNWPQEESFPVYADKDQISRVLGNLLKNATQAIPKDRKGFIEIDIQKRNQKIVASIADNGRGINEELSEKLFQPNFTTKSSGMGMGLAISKNIVEDLGGRIWFEKREAGGAIFYIELPVYMEE